MNLKRYLRGLGIGIIVTALIIGISSYRKTDAISDEEIKSRAQELGMVVEAEMDSAKEIDEDVLVDNAIDATDQIEVEESVATDLNEELEIVNEEDLIEKPEESTELEETSGVPDTDSNDIEVDPNEEVAEFILLSIHSGESSYAVASELESLEIVENATEFDAYLCTNGYATRIHVGDHEIPVNATYEEIANILCSSE